MTWELRVPRVPARTRGNERPRADEAETRREARVPLPPSSHELVSCVGAARPTWRKQSGCQQLASSAAAGEVDRVCGEPADEESAATCQASGRRGPSGDQLAPCGGLPPKARCTAAMSPRFGEPWSSILRHSRAWRKRFSGGLRQFARPTTHRLFARC